MGGRGASGGGNGGLSRSEKSYVMKNLPDTPRDYNYWDDAPKLTGTEKQVQWATSIRDDIADELFGYVMTQTSSGNPTNMMDIAFSGKQAMYKDISDNALVRSTTGKVRQEKIQNAVDAFNDSVGRYNRVIKLIDNHTSASFWIDNRTNTLKNYMNKRLKKYVDGK